MKKKQVSLIPEWYRFWESKISLKMRATLIVFLICVGQSFAVDAYSQTKRLSLNMFNVPVKSVLAAIEDQSEFYFMYEAHNVDVERKVSVSVENKSVPEILDELFDNTNITYKMTNRQIALTTEAVSSVGQQLLKVSGKVTDSSGGAIPGASIIVKGTNNGTIADSNGNFSLSGVSADASLIFSFVGMRAVEVEVNGKSIINVSMAEETVGIEEVVAVGYGIAKRSDVTGAIASVTSKNFENQPLNTLTSALQGRAAGVSITNLSGAPGGQTRIRIRGSNSITGGNNPLFVVDGMQLASFNMNDINPADIENIEILKDASATAIYGSRGANGVVLITTKKGLSEKTKIDFTTNFGIAQVANTYDLLDPVSYANQVNEVTPNTYPAAYIEGLKKGEGTEWQNEVFSTGKTKKNQLYFRVKKQK
jgi:TonB-dependent SusC/RagA subfamily outer membrane receptor